MKMLSAVGLWMRFGLGTVVGAALAVPVFFTSLLRGGRAVHKQGVLVRGELIARDSGVGARIAGPCWVRLSGAIADQDAGHDVLGVVIRMRSEAQAKAAAEDPTVGDQDVLLGTFESFVTAGKAAKTTHAGDYLDNAYSSVTPWWVAGMGPMIVRLAPDSSTVDGHEREAGAARQGSVSGRRSDPEIASGQDAAADGANRLERLDAAIAADRARWRVKLQPSGQSIDSSTEIAELRLLERTRLEGHQLRASMVRTGRGIVPVGFRNGIRAVLYPASQLGRAVRGR
jgi:hypothetical protein